MFRSNLVAINALGFVGVFGAAFAAESNNTVEKISRADFSENTELGTIAYIGAFKKSAESDANKVTDIKLGCQTLETNKTYYFFINHRSKEDSQKGKPGYFLVEIFLSRKDHNEPAFVELYRNTNKPDEPQAWVDQKTKFPSGNQDDGIIYSDGIKTFYDRHASAKSPNIIFPEDSNRDYNYTRWHARVSGNTETSFQLSSGDIYHDRKLKDGYYRKYYLLHTTIFDPGSFWKGPPAYQLKFPKFSVTPEADAESMLIRVTAPIYHINMEEEAQERAQGLEIKFGSPCKAPNE